MNIETLQQLCESFPQVTTDIKWDNDLCFSIGGKMFLVIGLDKQNTKASFKVQEEEFDFLLSREGFAPAPYLARYKWVAIENIAIITEKEWNYFAQQSYTLIKEKLPAKTKKELNIS